MNRISLNAGWQFIKLPRGIPVERENLDWETVSLPHTWYREEDPYHGLVLYRREIGVGKAWKKAFLEFEGADQRCRVFVNGKEIGEHNGAYARFRFPVPEAALKSGELRIEALLDNRVSADVSPNFGDFTIFGGLYRNVNLLVTSEDHFDYCYYGTDGVIARAAVQDDGSGLLALEPHVCTEREDACIVYTLTGPEGELAAESTAPAKESVSLRVPEPKLWNGKKAPELYTLRAELQIDGETADEAEIRVGFRTVSMSPDDGLRLNGEHIKLCGVAKHQDRAGVFSAVSREQIDEDFALIREIGANAIRLSHYQHPQHTYDRCDEDGLLCWAEVPMLKMTENGALYANIEQQLIELVLQNIHHPSIFCWGIQNEIGMFRDAPFMHEECRVLTALAKRLDPNRLVTAANLYNVKPASQLNAITDMVGYNLYFGWYYGEMPDYSKYLDNYHAQRPEMPLGISEYGVDCNVKLHSETPRVKDYSEEFQALWHETVYPVLQSKDYLWGSFIWNMFDFSSDRRSEGGVKYINGKGLVSHDRTLRKDAFYYYKAKWSAEPFVHLCARRFVKRCRETVDVKVYTNQNAVTLFVNGAERETLSNNGNGTVLFRDVALEPGENRLKAVSGELADSLIFERVEIAEESYRLPEETSGPVRNWFLSDDDTVKEGYYSIMDTAEDVLSGARSVLVRFVPSLVEVLDRDMIPLGLSMKSILSRELKNDPDTMLRINDALH
ncbi:MAG: beta-galactosidase, partial [Oscillospiraceae bacterium]|nr:beta-galactosidase [Oscillospiraceae bacterium]